ncbi:hypothetical protein MMR65_26220, partial [Escherichia coli]|nr:hypothetical protein [Escherichia coli]MCM4460390.1 hypothetical protein [Escherichia coli]
TLANRLEIWVDGSPLLIERLHVANGELTCVARKPWVGTMLFYLGNETQLAMLLDKLDWRQPKTSRLNALTML